MSRLFWMHTDCLAVPPCEPAVFVFDDEQIEAGQWGLKRLLFLYECLLELPVAIKRGRTVEALVALAGQDTVVVTVSSPDPWIREQIRLIRERVAVEVLPAPEYVELPENVDLTRFSRYWKRAEKLLL